MFMKKIMRYVHCSYPLSPTIKKYVGNLFDNYNIITDLNDLGESLHNSILHLLTVGYELVDRDEFATIITAHLANRIKGPDVDMFEKYRK